MADGWIKLWRQSLDRGWLRNGDLWRFWCWCLLRANHEACTTMVGYQKVELQPGQFVFGRKAASLDLKMSQKTVRTCLENLKKLENLAIKSTNKFSIVSIINWGTYQGGDNTDGPATRQTGGQQVANKWPTSGQQVATDKNERMKECKKELKTYSASPDAANGNSHFLTRKKRKLTGKRLESFDAFWEAFAYKKGKAEAADAWLDIPVLTDSVVDQIIEAARAEALSRPALVTSGRTPKMAQGWISGRRWEDEIKGCSPCVNWMDEMDMQEGKGGS